MQEQIIQIGNKNLFVHTNNGIIINGTEREVQKHLTHVPLISQHEVFGRDIDLQNVKNLLVTNDKIVLVSGIRGIGKTTLAKAFLNKNLPDFNHIAWIDIPEKGRVKDAFALNTQIVDNLNLLESTAKLNGSSFIDTSFDLITNRLRELKGNNLLIIDNVGTDIENTLILDKIALKPHWKVLVTSNKKLEGFKDYELDLLDKENAKKLFKLHYTIEENDEAVSDIVSKLGYHTLTIEITAKHAQALRYSLEDIKKNLKNSLSLLSNKSKIKIKHSHNLVISNILFYLKNLFNISELASDEKYVLSQLILFPSLPILYFNKNTQEDMLTLLNMSPNQKDKYTIALNKLVAKGWINWNKIEDSFRVHELVKEVAISKLKPSYKKCSQTIDGLRDLCTVNFDADNPVPKFKWVKYTESALDCLRNDFSPVLGLLSNSTGILNVTQGNYNKGIPYYEFALKRTTDENQRIKCFNNLMIVNKNLGNYTEAISIGESLLAREIIRLGEINFIVANIKSNLAVAYYESENYTKAEVLFTEALITNIKLFGEVHQTVALRKSNLAEIKRLLNKPDESWVLLQSALKIDCKLFGENHLETVRIFTNFGSYYFSRKDSLALSLKYYQKALNIYYGLVDVDHPSIGLLFYSIGELYNKHNQYENALKYLNLSLDIRLKRLGKNHPHTLKTLKMIDDCLIAMSN